MIATANMRNCRESTDEEQFKALVDSMAIDNQINAVSVMVAPQHEDQYVLIAGFQRFRAACALRWKTIRASVFEVKTEFDAYMINFAENLARSTPSTYDQARHCQYLVGRCGISESDLAARMGRSYAHVHNLIKYLSLPPSIVEDWKNGHPRLSLSVLQRLASPTTPNPAEIWAKLRAQHTKEEQALPMLSAIEQLASEQRLDEDDGSDGHTSFKRPTKAKMIKLRDVLSRQRMPSDPAEFRELLLDVVDYCRGAKAGIRGVVFAGLSRRKKHYPSP